MFGYSYSAHIGYLFSDKPIHERVAAAARYGFAAIEHPSPYSIPASQMADWLKSSGLRYTQFGLHSGDAAKGEKGIGIFPERRTEFRASVKAGLNYAEAAGVRMVHAMAGILSADKQSHHHWDCYVENLAFAAHEGKLRGIKIIVEPMSPGAVPDYFLQTPDRAAHAIAEAGGENLGLLLDIFHTANLGLDIGTQIEKHAAIIAHVHIADFPGRHEPGSAQLNFDDIERALRRVGYDGLLGCEYIPANSSEEGLGWLQRRMALSPAT